MIKTIRINDNITNSNLVILIENNDKDLINNLDLEDNIIQKINKTIEKGENKKLEFFLGEENLETLFILFYNNKSNNTLIEFLGEIIPTLPHNLTLLSKDKNIKDFIDTTILSRYKFNKYKTEELEDTINIIINNNTEKFVKERLETLNNIIFSRNLGEMPASDLYPEEYVNIIKNINFKNTKVKILDSEQIKKEGLNLIDAVGKGSPKKPYMVILERIIDKSLPTVGIVGKGITFDTGGIQVKPGDYMYEMKGDMCGSASVLATMKELDNKDLNVNIIACLVLAENNVSGNSYRPSDIIKSYSGKTVNIVHTDAEGRLVLADGISYISKNYNLDKIITMATLTGTAMMALGYRYAGIMSNDKDLKNIFREYSENNFEKYIELPFDNYYIRKTKSNIADLDNLNRGVQAGASMGAAFLANFVLNDEKFTHLDIAGPAINTYEPYGLMNKGMTGFGVDSLSSILTNLK